MRSPETRDAGWLDRRAFLRTSAGFVAGGGLWSAACGEGGPADHPSVALVRQSSYDPATLQEAFVRAFDLLGGIEALVRSKNVTVKVNLTGYAAAMFGRPPGETYVTHPATALALATVLRGHGAARVRFVESCPIRGTFEAFASGFGWDCAQLAAPGGVSFENTRNLGSASRYAQRDVPGSPRLFSHFLLNRSYTDTDVLISLAKMKNHVTAGVTLSMKNLFGITPNALYGTEATSQGENATAYRGCLHNRAEGNVATLPGERPGFEARDAFFRVPRIVTDIVAARPIDLAIVDGITTVSGGEGPWNVSSAEMAFLTPGVLVMGRDPVATDAVCVRVMGYADPLVARGTPPFAFCDNHILMAHEAALGVGDMADIDVRGERIDDVVTRFA